MNAIPAELLQDILRKCESSGDLINCALVCKRWSCLALEVLWYKPAFHVSLHAWITFFTIIQATHQTTTFPYAAFVRRINLSPLSLLIEDLHIMALRSCKRLERLTLAGCSKLTDVGLCTLLHAIGPTLVSLDLSDVYQITDATITAAATSCPQLQGFNLSMSRVHHSITDASVTRLAAQCTHMKRIKLNNCTHVSHQAAIALSQHCPRLIEIDLTNCSITNAVLVAIFRHNRELRELRLSQADRSTPQMDDTAFHSLQHHGYQQLRLVDLTGIARLSDVAIDTLVRAAPKIKSLVLNKCPQITDHGVLAIARLGRYLHFLHLGHCAQITDASIQRLAAACLRLRYLDLASCTNITDAAVAELAKHLPRLKRIGLVKCSRITDAAVHSLARHARIAGSIERIHLSFCSRLSVRAITELLNACQRLSHLSLTHVPSFMREDLQQFCRPPPKDLTELQRGAFCVYSGPGVQHLKDYLNIMQLEQNYGHALLEDTRMSE
ncbi:hypothetical protein MBANPS3_011432 [Mucor bainieri]